MLVENKYVAIAAAVGFLLMLWLSDGSMFAAFGVLALVAGVGWAVQRLLRPTRSRHLGQLDRTPDGDTR